MSSYIVLLFNEYLVTVTVRNDSDAVLVTAKQIRQHKHQVTDCLLWSKKSVELHVCNALEDGKVQYWYYAHCTMDQSFNKAECIMEECICYARPGSPSICNRNRLNEIIVSRKLTACSMVSSMNKTICHLSPRVLLQWRSSEATEMASFSLLLTWKRRSNTFNSLSAKGETWSFDLQSVSN